MRIGARMALCLLLTAAPAEAQVSALLDAGVGRSGLVSLGPQLWWQQGTARVELSGEYRDFGGIGTAAIGRLNAGWIHAIGGPVSAELTGTVVGQTGAGLTRAGAGWGGLRLHLIERDRGLWLGVEAGREYLGPVRRWEAAAWKRMGSFSLQLQGWQTATALTADRADTAPSFPDTLNPATTGSGAQSRTTTDLGLWLSWAGTRTELAVASGIRLASRDLAAGAGGTLSSTWWMAEGTWWLTNRVGMVGALGRLPIDPSLATTGEGFLRLGFRAALEPRHAAYSRAAPRVETAFQARRGSGELVEFRLTAPPGTRRVELMADFTDWRPIALEPIGGQWASALPAPPGLHRINVRYDGGPWRAPPATRVVWDEFGAESGEVLLQ